VQKQSDLPPDFLSFLSFSFSSLSSLIFFLPAPSHVVSSSSRVYRHRVSLSCRTGQEEETSDLFFIPCSLLRAFENPCSGGARRSGAFFHSARCKRRECVAGVNQSMSPRIRLYGTSEFWMTSRDSRDEARCVEKRNVRKHFAFLSRNLLRSFNFPNLVLLKMTYINSLRLTIFDYTTFCLLI